MRAFTPGQPGPPPALTAPPLPAHVAAVLDPFEWGALAARADVVAMVVSAAGGRVEAVTPACADSWGAAPAEWQQQCLENFVHPHDWHPLRMALDRLARSSLARAAQGISSSSISGGGGDTSTGSGISSGFHVATASSSLANAAAIVPQRSEPLQPLDVAVNIATGFDRYARVVLWGRALVPRLGPDMASPDDFPALLIVAFDASDGVAPPALADQPGRFDMVVSADSTVLFVSPFVFSPLGWRPCELVNRDISTIIATNVQTVSTVLRAITATRGRADGIERSTVSVQLQHRDGLSRSAMLLIHPCPVSASSVSQYLEIIAIVLPGAATTQRVSPPTIGDLVHASPTLEPYQQQPSYQQQQPFQQQQQLQPQRAIKSEPAGAWTGDDAAIEQARRRYRPARRVTLVSNDSQRSSSSSSSSSSTPSARRVSASASTATSSSNSSSSRGRSRSGDDEQRKAAGKVVRRAASDGRAMDEPGTTEFMFKHTPHTRAYKRLPVVTDNKQCTSCGTSVTPEWRRGPEGPKTLCNACGLQYAKLAKEDPQFAAALERPASAPSDAEHRWHAQQSSSVFSRRGTSLPTFPAGPTDAFAQNPHEPLYSFDAGHAVAHFPHLYGGDTATDWASQLPAMPVPTVPVTYPWPPANDHLAHAYAHPAPPFMDPFAQPLSDAHMGSDAAISTSPGGFYREHQQHDQPPPPGRP